MRTKAIHFIIVLIISAFFGVVGLTGPSAVTHKTAIQPPSDHHVYIAFGFHVNLYHSFRGSTNDEFGFGKDIRIIRHIISTLDHYNAKGIPVKAIWDFDNLFSLQEILPQYAPDIINDIKRRVQQQGDEIILMSYNNGMVSAMTGRELENAMRWAVSNPWGSGVDDIFGSHSPIVRPQEMMTTPGNFSLYRQIGIEAVALYYSATPFDAFRVFSRPLTPAEAHNPVLYDNPATKEKMIIVPTYHIGDLVENVSLRHWATRLHKLQQKGELQQDALIFINYDADSDFWTGVDMSWPLEWLPNTSGISGLIENVQDLPFVRFTRLNDYLKSHTPTGDIHFNQDTADGSFNGYNSWAEKADVPTYWTRIERSRRLRRAAVKTLDLIDLPQPQEKALQKNIDAADLKRLRVLSTTHFGLATPFVAWQREQEVRRLLSDLDRNTDEIEKQIHDPLRRYLARQKRPSLNDPSLEWLDTFIAIQTDQELHQSGGRFLKLYRPAEEARHRQFVLVRPDGKRIPVINLSVDGAPSKWQWLSLYLPGEVTLSDGVYHLYGRSNDRIEVRAVKVGVSRLSNSRIDVRFDADAHVEGVYLNGQRQTEPGSLTPYLQYANRLLKAGSLRQQWRHGGDGRAASMQVSGSWPGPEESTIKDGSLDYTFTVMAERPYLIVRGHITYPATERKETLNAGQPGLMRRADMRWQQVAPAEIRLTAKGSKEDPIRILKSNYLGVESRYSADNYRHATENLNMDNLNNHITAAYVGLVAGDRGAAVAMDTTVQANFAFAPLKIHFNPAKQVFNAQANPFGTYHGRQYKAPTWGNGQGFEITKIAGEQYASAGPTYNGVSQRFALLITFFNGEKIPIDHKADLHSFAHPPLVIALTDLPPDTPAPAPIQTPRGFIATQHKGNLHFHWDSIGRTGLRYRIYFGTRSGQYDRSFTASGNSLHVVNFDQTKSKRYFARIEAVSPSGRTSVLSPEISFKADSEVHHRRPSVPVDLELRLLWANLQALLLAAFL